MYRLLNLLVFVAGFAAAGFCQEPQKVTICQLENDPPAYDHTLIEVAGFVSHDFEDFTLFDPDCPPSTAEIWLEYGGTAASGTMYCCGVTADRDRPKQLVVENIPITLIDDKRFREFDKLIQPPFRSGKHGSIVHATIVGRFFSGQKEQFPKGGSRWGGYGHMGCCSLLAIQEIRSVDPQNRPDLDYGASPDQPDTDKIGCGYQDLISLQPYRQVIEAQQQAELGQRSWAFDDPQRVASDALARLLEIHQDSITGMRETRKAQGRIVYEWRRRGKRPRYMVVVSRPYWLSFYSHNAKKVAWVVIAAYKSCG